MIKKHLDIFCTTGILLYIISWILFFNVVLDRSLYGASHRSFKLWGTFIIHVYNFLLTLFSIFFSKQADHSRKILNWAIPFYKHFSIIYFILLIIYFIIITGINLGGTNASVISCLKICFMIY